MQVPDFDLNCLEQHPEAGDVRRDLADREISLKHAVPEVQPARVREQLIGPLQLDRRRGGAFALRLAAHRTELL